MEVDPWGRSASCRWQVSPTLCKQPSFLLCPSLRANTDPELGLWLVNEPWLLKRQLGPCKPVLSLTGNSLPQCVCFVHASAPSAKWRQGKKKH